MDYFDRVHEHAISKGKGEKSTPRPLPAALGYLYTVPDLVEAAIHIDHR